MNQISNIVTNPQISVIQKSEKLVETSDNSLSDSFESGDAPRGLLPADKAKKVVESMNKFIESTGLEIKYEFHEELEKYYVTLVDSTTNEVMREIPSKKLMDMYVVMLEFAGIFVDEKI